MQSSSIIRRWIRGSLLITVLVLASFFVGVYFDMGYIHIADMIAGNADEEGVMMAFITLNMVEIFHCFNMRSRRASLFTMKKQNKWLWASAALALVLTVAVVYDALVLLWYNPEPMKSVAALLVLCILGCSFLEPYLFGAYMEKQPIQFLFLLLSGYLDCWRAELRKSK